MNERINMKQALIDAMVAIDNSYYSPVVDGFIRFWRRWQSGGLASQRSMQADGTHLSPFGACPTFAAWPFVTTLMAQR